MATGLGEVALLHARVAEVSGRLGEAPSAVATRPGQPWVGLTSHYRSPVTPGFSGSLGSDPPADPVTSVAALGQPEPAASLR